MSGTMSKGDLIESLKGMLGETTLGKFKTTTDDDGSSPLERHMTAALEHFSRVRKRVKFSELTLVADQSNYASPGGVLDLGYHTWGRKEQRERSYWDSNYIRSRDLPRMSLIEGDSGEEIYLDPAPTAALIADLGTEFVYRYHGLHAIADLEANTTVKAEDRHLLLVRILAASLQELATRVASSPVSLGQGAVAISMAKNGTPAALAAQAMKLFYQMAGISNVSGL